MIGREYLSRQALTLLKLARVTKDPDRAAYFTQQAADLQARLEEAPIVREQSLSAPAIQDIPREHRGASNDIASE
jgi:hypothetical protein